MSTVMGTTAKNARAASARTFPKTTAAGWLVSGHTPRKSGTRRLLRSIPDIASISAAVNRHEPSAGETGTHLHHSSDASTI